MARPAGIEPCPIRTDIGAETRGIEQHISLSSRDVLVLHIDHILELQLH